MAFWEPQKMLPWNCNRTCNVPLVVMHNWQASYPISVEALTQLNLF